MKVINSVPVRVCPKCGKEFRNPPVQSRDSDEMLCPDCGILQSLKSLGISDTECVEILRIVHKYTQASVIELHSES